MATSPNAPVAATSVPLAVRPVVVASGSMILKTPSIILLTGPSGAGKSTTARAFLARAEGEWAYLAQDEIRQLVKTGYSSADGYEQDWSVATKRQWAVSVPLITDMTRRYVQAGINVIIDCFAPPDEFDVWQRHLRGMKVTSVLLLPSEQHVVDRNAKRSREGGRLKENKVRQNYVKYLNWNHADLQVIDSSKLTVQDVVQNIYSLI